MKSMRWLAIGIAITVAGIGCGGGDGTSEVAASSLSGSGEATADTSPSQETDDPGGDEPVTDDTSSEADVQREEGIALLTADGMSRAGAECFVDAMIDGYGLEKLNSNDDLTPDEESAVQQIAVDCGLMDELAEAAATETTVAATEEAGATDTVAETAPASLFGALDFAPACRGVGITAAADYVPGDGTNHIVGVVGEDPTYDTGLYGALADGWEAEWEQIDQTELVVCLDRTATVEGQLCTGYEDEESGLSWEVQTFGADYAVTLREATTAAVVAETSLTVEPDSCPSFSFYSSDDPSPKPDYATPDDALQAWLVSYVNA